MGGCKMSRGSKLQARIWCMDTNLTTLDSIRDLLALNYYEPIEYLTTHPINSSEKTLLHRWNNISQTCSYQIRISDTIHTVEYFTAVGFLEKSAPKTKAFADDEFSSLLSRDRRITEYRSNAIFLKFHERIFAIIYGSNSAFNVRTILMGNGFSHRRKPEWGKIDDKPSSYNLSNDFFYWKFNKYDKHELISSNGTSIEVRDVKGIGRLSEREQCDTKGFGPNYLNEISSKSSLGCNHSIYQSDFELVTEKVNMIACLNQNADCTIDLARTTFRLPNGQVDPVYGNEVNLLLHIYLELIPSLTSAYNNENSSGIWNTRISTAAQKTWSLDVISELCQLHNITLDEIGIKVFRQIS